jgi:hypothetical protein
LVTEQREEEEEEEEEEERRVDRYSLFTISYCLKLGQNVVRNYLATS